VNLGGAFAPRPISYREALAWLYGTQRYGIKLSLDNIRRLQRELSLRLSAHVIHVAGTNGKGSVCAMAEAICRVAGYRTGLFTSPHLVTFRERIRVNGKMICEADVADGLAIIRELVAGWGTPPTFFEITTALALRHFQTSSCEVVILETGMGGRLDATNAVPASASVITPIDFDHEKWLGRSIAQIAREKAGIIKTGVPVISAVQPKEAEEIIRRRAQECEAPLQFISERWEETPIALRGRHQQQNAAVAVAAVRAAGLEVSDEAIARGLASVDWPARFQIWDERIVIDGAHNPAGARTLAHTWREELGEAKATVILAILRDKDAKGIIDALRPIAREFLLPQIRSDRAESPRQLAKVLSSITPSLPYSITSSLEDTFSTALSFPTERSEVEKSRGASKPRILITGSLHFAGEALAILRGEPDAFEECAQ
jgi:dihydrofolate synthase/folylpolyglutamate synthase